MKDHVQGIEPVSYFDATPDNIEIHRRIGKTELEGRLGNGMDLNVIGKVISDMDKY